MASLQELLAQKEALEREIELTKKQERNAAVNKVRALMAEYGLSAADLTARKPANAKANPLQYQQSYRFSLLAKSACRQYTHETGLLPKHLEIQPPPPKATLNDWKKYEISAECGFGIQEEWSA